MKKQFLEAGRIVGTHGVRGEMRVEPWCDSADFLKKVKTLYFDGGKTDAGLLSSRVHKSLLLVRLKGVESATQADLYRGKILYLDRNDVRLPKNRYFVEVSSAFMSSMTQRARNTARCRTFSRPVRTTCTAL